MKTIKWAFLGLLLVSLTGCVIYVPDYGPGYYGQGYYGPGYYGRRYHDRPYGPRYPYGR